MTPFYCVSCYLEDGKGTIDARYMFNGKSLCNFHMWEETKTIDRSGNVRS